MLFNSLTFALFLPVVFLLHWFVAGKKLHWQNGLLLLASYYFYACWDWRFLFLLIFSTLLDYVTGLQMARSGNKKHKRFWFWLSICINLGFLGFFKYYNFFITSFAAGLGRLGLHTDPWTLQIILPVGISFYTFHGLSYVIDSYYGRIQPEKGFLKYALFVSFFPLLVAGPIERATHLLPQLREARVFDAARARDGLRQMLWGFFKKMVVADNCARLVTAIFADYQHKPALTLIAGGVLFMFQVYGDFSGYSDIAIGCARLFGISLMRNFAYPYFSRDLAEFWQRWHISFSSWFRDYVYFPLGGSRVSRPKLIRNVMIVFLLSGLWHGAAWTYIIWGGLHGIFFLANTWLGNKKKHPDIVADERLLPSVKELSQMILTFALCTLCLTIFRSASVPDAFRYLQGIFTHHPGTPGIPADVRWYIVLMLAVEWLQRHRAHGLMIDTLRSKALRWGIYTALVFLIFFAGATKQSFIYFQF